MSAVQVGLVLVVALSLTAETWDRLQPPAPGKLLAGAGGMPGGREAGHWIDENTPENSVFLTIGPSMANIVQFYGHRKAYGLSVSANPLHRNPSYEPVQNADLKIRSGEAQYLVFDVYSAARTSYFRDRMDHLVKKYKGRIVHVEYLPGTANGAENAANRIIIIYEVYPDYEAKP